MKIINIVAGVIVGIIVFLGGIATERQAATVRAEALAERQTLLAAVEARRDLAGTLVVVCGAPVGVQIFKRDGSHETYNLADLDGVHLGGLAARLKSLPKDNRASIVINRGCGTDL